MKTVFVTPNYPPTICGIGDHTSLLARELAGLGHESHIVCSTNQTRATGENGIFVHPVATGWGRAGADAFAEVLDEVRPDRVVMQYTPHGFHMKGLPFGLWFWYRAMRRRGIPAVTFFHEVKIRPWDGRRNAVASFLQDRIADRLARASVRTATSIDIYAGYLKKWGHETALVPIGSNVPRAEATGEQLHDLRKSLSIAAGGPVVATFGNRDVVPYLPAFDRLAAEFPDLTWLLCGKNPTRKDVLSSRPYFRVVGELPSAALYRHLLLGDVFFSPDLVGRRGDGGTCNKSSALACGLSLGIPVVGARGDMNNALLRHGENILLVDLLDERELAETFRGLFLNKERAAALGLAARKLHDEHLAWPISAQKMLAVLDPARQQG